MRRGTVAIFAALILMVVGVGCSSGDRVEDTEGTVLLVVSNFDGLPGRVAVNDQDAVQIGSIDIDNVPKNSNLGTSPLQDVEMRSYEVVYTRVDTGTREPAPLVRSVFGLAPVGGTLTYENLTVLTATQMLNPPLSDLLFDNGGVDTETGSQVITLELRMRFFGRTLAGNNVATAPVAFEVEFVPAFLP